MTVTTLTSAQTRRVRCPNCSRNEVARLAPDLFRPLLPVGQCWGRCRRCEAIVAIETAVWWWAQAGGQRV